MTEPELRPFGLSEAELRAFWISLAANAVLFAAIALAAGWHRAGVRT